jgi:multiple sugar transport system ATP-binding protein
MASVTLERLVRHHPGAAAPALRGLDLAVEDGELLVVVGPSGCGKSTALRLIAGLDEPDSGRVRIGDRDVAGVPPQDRDVAMVFQGYALYPHLTVRDNVAFPLRMRNVTRTERERRVLEAAEMLGLTKLLDRLPSELSGGERQRVAMGRAIVREPKVFLFDEPLSNLDAALRAELRVDLAALVRKVGTTSIYVTHDQVEAMTMGDRIAVMRVGELEQLGTPREVYESPATTYVASFLGSPPINLVETTPADGKLRAPGLDLPVPEGAPKLPERVVVGIRPEHVQVGPKADGAWSAQARVTVVEPLGPETILHADVGGTALRARVLGMSDVARGDAIRISADPRVALLFDAATGRRLA